MRTAHEYCLMWLVFRFNSAEKGKVRTLHARKGRGALRACQVGPTFQKAIGPSVLLMVTMASTMPVYPHSGRCIRNLTKLIGLVISTYTSSPIKRTYPSVKKRH